MLTSASESKYQDKFYLLLGLGKTAANRSDTDRLVLLTVKAVAHPSLSLYSNSTWATHQHTT